MWGKKWGYTRKQWYIIYFYRRLWIADTVWLDDQECVFLSESGSASITGRCTGFWWRTAQTGIWIPVQRRMSGAFYAKRCIWAGAERSRGSRSLKRMAVKMHGRPKKKVRSLFPMNRCIWTFWLTMKRRNFIFFILWTIWQKRAKSLPFYRIWKKMEHRNQRMECIAGWLKIKIWK